MNYPDCPDKRTDCRFAEVRNMETMIHSPIEYNREGQPVGGGMNIITTTILCRECGNFWKCTQTELEKAQGVPPQWEQV